VVTRDFHWERTKRRSSLQGVFVRLTEKSKQRALSEGPEGRNYGASLAFDSGKDRAEGPAPERKKPPRESTDTKAPPYNNGKVYPLAENGQFYSPYPTDSADRDLTRFQKRLTRGRVKLCPDCNGVMTKSSRMILSPFSGLLLLIMGMLLMALYGLATNFFQVPWFAKYALPAIYYIGSILLGVGILFFFVRERVWKCDRCREIRKR
jgi:hypothetical protein